MLLRLLPGGANQFPGGYTPLWTITFHGAPDYDLPGTEEHCAWSSADIPCTAGAPLVHFRE